MYHSPVFPSRTSSKSMSGMQLLLCPQKKFSIERYKPLSFGGIKGFPNKIPDDIRKNLPKFTPRKIPS